MFQVKVYATPKPIKIAPSIVSKQTWKEMQAKSWDQGKHYIMETFNLTSFSSILPGIHHTNLLYDL